MISGLDAATAKRIITKLKAGTTPIDCVRYVNVGNERWYHAASELFDQISQDNDSLVRFINGYYGDGKTHFLGMLSSLALDKSWLVSYVTTENTPLNKFDRVYSEIIKKAIIPPSARILPWLQVPNMYGAYIILASLFSKVYLDIYRPGDKTGLQKQNVLASLRFRKDEIATAPGIDEIVGTAIRGFFEAIIRSDMNMMQRICSWLEGGKIAISELGIKKHIDQVYSRDAMRSISQIVKSTNIKGVLILLDEAERIMDQTKPTRNKSYGVIRDLLDNADNKGGMQSCIIYIAATPETFSSEKGFAEYDALRSRLAGSKQFVVEGFVDWRAVIVDLTKTPPTPDLLIKMSQRICAIHSIARNWDATKVFNDQLIIGIVNHIDQGVFQVSKLRMLASAITTLLEMSEQNRDQNIEPLIKRTIDTVQRTLVKKPQVEEWE